MPAALDTLRETLPEAAKDIRLNIQSVLEGGTLSAAQKWGVALASAFAARNASLREAVLADAITEVDGAVVEDARAAAVLMAMNNVYYRFRHMVGKESYATKPARLRMQWIARPLGNKVDFELFCLAVSAINGCETCVKSHEAVVVTGGISEDQVNDAIRIAATVNAMAVALES